MDITKFIDKLYNKNGKLEGQRLKEKWFIKNGYNEELDFFKEKNILKSKNLYMYIHNESDKCECGNVKRFIGFRDGFKEYCQKCARTKNNWMKNGKETFSSENIKDILKFVKDLNGNYSTSKLKKLSENTIKFIKSKIDFLDENSTIAEYLYNIEHNNTFHPECKNCGSIDVKFISSKKGYLKTCSNTCGSINSVEQRINSQLKYHYENFKEKYKIDGYQIELFTLDDYLNSSYTDIKFKHLKCGHEYVYDLSYQGALHCPKCFTTRSKTQYEIYSWISNFISVKYNDRQLIKPKEIDILSETFGIEYDSLMFHSFGKSELDMFNNTNVNINHNLEKTELCEDKGIQLFRIFSNEWERKQDIWKSVIFSKMGCTEKIYARKCNIKEVPSNESNSFLEQNHLQGKTNGSIRLGLYYNNELVSLMTFGKSRYNKSIQYELIRFCSKLNTTVVGGASKLLKYFERNYNPDSIISYANRRWSQGNLYEKLGFEFINNTVPNYFYFKNDLDELQSRVQFQKHKLKDKLKQFDPELTETENMFNNGYRKIYDCGNKVYIKKYK